jgi:hypothetical protein
MEEIEEEGRDGHIDIKHPAEREFMPLSILFITALLCAILRRKHVAKPSPPLGLVTVPYTVYGCTMCGEYPYEVNT